MLKNRFKGFTLAEVLIAMTIVGVIAALTVPALTSNTQAKAKKLKARKVYTSLISAIDTGIAAAGYDFSTVVSIDGAAPSVTDILEKSLKVKTKANKSDEDSPNKRKESLSGGLPLATSGDCTESADYGIEKYCTHFSVRNRHSGIVVTYKLADGAQLLLFEPTTVAQYGCVSDDKEDSDRAAHPCLALIDINGEKGPNNVIQCTDNTTGVWTLEKKDDVFTWTMPAACEIEDNAITDIYPVIIFDDRIEPATSAAMAILEGDDEE